MIGDAIRELSTRLPPRAKANLAKTISMNTDDRWDGSIAVPGARLYKRRLKSTKGRIRITKVLPSPGPLFPIVLIGIHGVRGRPFYQYHIIPDAIMSYRAIVSREAYRQPLNTPLPLSPPFNVSLSHSLLPFNRSIIDQLGKRERKETLRFVEYIYIYISSGNNNICIAKEGSISRQSNVIL